MRKKIKVNEHIIDKVQSKIDSRGNIDQFAMRFLINFGISYEVLKLSKENFVKKEYIEYSMKQCIVSLISYIETLLRDIFIFILKERPGYYDLVTKEYSLTISGEFDKGNKYLLAEIFNFQNIKDIERAFKVLFESETFFEEIGSFVVNKYDSSDKIIKKFSLDKSLPNWLENLNEVIKTRHNIVHDGNYNLIFSEKKLNEYQKCILCFGQVFSLYVAYNFNLPVIVIEYDKRKKPIPYFLGLEDFEHEWIEIDEV